MGRRLKMVMMGVIAASALTPALADTYYFRASNEIIVPKAAPVVEAKVTLATATLPSAKVGQPWTYDFGPLATTENVAAGSLAWSASGLPAWLSLSTAGIGTGTPAAIGDASISVTAAGGGKSSTAPYTIKVGGAPLVASKVESGSNFSCALTPGGAVLCWGANWTGQLGIGPGSDTKGPTTAAIASGATALSVGGNTVCAVVSGAVKCWGSNNKGQLGIGGTASTNAPGTAAIASGATAVGVGDNHACAVVSGAVRCWGYNSSGQLGNNSTTDSSTAVSTGITSGATALAASSGTTCALVGGALKCWGYNFYGQVGDGTTTTPQKTASSTAIASGVSAVAMGGDHTCVLTTGGAVRCWGYNGNGQLGTANNTNVVGPQTSTVLAVASGASSVAANGNYTCAVVSGATQCWGMNSAGQLGTGDKTSTNKAGTAVVASGSAAVDAGSNFACALMADSSVKCWGANESGQLGNGTTTASTSAVDVVPG